VDLVERREGTPRRHPWETARVEAVKSIIERLPLHRPRVLDVGCGDGYLLLELKRSLDFRQAMAVDPHLTDELIREVSSPEVRFVRELGELSAERLDLVLLLDVLEHIERPSEFLRGIAADHLAAGGWGVVTVPAFQSLFSRHDRKLLHFRRYTRRTIGELVASAGLEVVDSGYLFASLLLPRALSSFLQWARLPGQHIDDEGIGNWQGSAFSTRALHRALSLDNSLCLLAHDHGLTVPGLSIWLTCKKPS
jgi:hypothetical protein